LRKNVLRNLGGISYSIKACLSSLGDKKAALEGGWLFDYFMQLIEAVDKLPELSTTATVQICEYVPINS